MRKAMQRCEAAVSKLSIDFSGLKAMVGVIKQNMEDWGMGVADEEIQFPPTRDVPGGDNAP